MMSSAIKDFKSKLNGLLTSLHTLSGSEQEVAVSLLSSTLSAELSCLPPLEKKTQTSPQLVITNIDSPNRKYQEAIRDPSDSSSQYTVCNLLEEIGSSPYSSDRKVKLDKLLKRRGSIEHRKSKPSSCLPESSTKNDVQHHRFESNKLGAVLLSQPPEIFSRSQACASSSETCLSLEEIKTQSQEKRPLFEKIFHASQSGANCQPLQLSVLKSTEVPSKSVRVISREDSKVISPRFKVVKPQAVSLKPERCASSKVSSSPSEGSKASAESFHSQGKIVPAESARNTLSNEENSQEELANNKAHQQTSLPFSQGLSSRAETVLAHVQASTLPQQTKYTSDKIRQAQQQATLSLQCHESVHSMVYQISSSNDVSYRSWGKIQTQANGIQPEANVSQIQGSVPQTQECLTPSATGVSQVTDGSLIIVDSCDASGPINDRENPTVGVSSPPSYVTANLGQRNPIIGEDLNRSDGIDGSTQPSPLALDKYSMARDLREATETLEKSFSSLKEQQQWHLQQQTLVFTDPLVDHFGAVDEVVCRRSLPGNADGDILDHVAPSHAQRATQLLDHSLKVLGFNQATRECGLDVFVSSHFDLPSDFSEVLDYSMQGKPEKLTEDEMPTDLSVDHEFDLKSMSGGSKIIEVTNISHRIHETKESMAEVSQPTDLSLSNMHKDKCVLTENHPVGAAYHSTGSWSLRKELVSNSATKESQSSICSNLSHGLFLHEPTQQTVAHKVLQEEQVSVQDDAYDYDHLLSNSESMHRKCAKRKNVQFENNETNESNSSKELPNFGVQDVVYDLSLPPAVNGSEKTELCDASYAPVLAPEMKANPHQTTKKAEILSFGDFSINLDTIIPDYAKNFPISASAVDDDLQCEVVQPKASSSSRAAIDETLSAPVAKLAMSTIDLTVECSSKTAALNNSKVIYEFKDKHQNSLKTLSSNCEVNKSLDVENSNVHTNNTNENVLPANEKSSDIKEKVKNIKEKSRTKCLSSHKLRRKTSSALKSKVEDNGQNCKLSGQKALEAKLLAKQAYTCEICSIEFVHKVTYVRHVRGHSSNKCSLCPSSFSSRKALRHHSLVSHSTHIQAKTYDCPLCWRSFSKRVLLHAHTAKQHAAQGMHVCRKCGAELPSAAALQQHLQEHSSSELPCSLCSATFSRRQTLLVHLRGHERNVCRECGAACSSSRQLMAHCRLAHPVSGPQLSSSTDLPRQDSDKNATGDVSCANESPDSCSLKTGSSVALPEASKCSLQSSPVFQRKVQLEKRIRRAKKTEKNIPAGKSSCDLSGAGEACQAEVDANCLERASHSHVPSCKESQNYPAENALECDTASTAGRHCGQLRPSRKVAPTRHKFCAPSHVFGRIHCCPHCPRQFGRPSLLKEHMATHAGGSSFRCERCNKSFATRSGHRKHLSSAQHVSSRPRCAVPSIEDKDRDLGMSDSFLVTVQSAGNNSVHAKADAPSSQEDNRNNLSHGYLEKDIRSAVSGCGSFILHQAEVAGAGNMKGIEDIGGASAASDVDPITDGSCSGNSLVAQDSSNSIDKANENNISLEDPRERNAGIRVAASVACVPSLLDKTSDPCVPVLQHTIDGDEVQEMTFEGDNPTVNGSTTLYQTVAGKKPNFACNICDYVTNSKFCIKRHIDNHFNRRRFVCEACGKAFLSLLNLQDHHAFVHSTEKRFTCSHCSNSFKTRSSLVRHLQKHSSEKPYQCHCGNKYKRLSYLKRHQLNAHNEVPKVRNLMKVSALIHLSSSDDTNLISEEAEVGRSSDFEQKSAMLSTHQRIDAYDENPPLNIACSVNLTPKSVEGTAEILDLTHVTIRKNCVAGQIDANGVLGLKVSEPLTSLPLVRDASKNVVLLFNHMPCVKMSLPSQNSSNFFISKSEVSACEATHVHSRMVSVADEEFGAGTTVCSGPADVATALDTRSTALNSRATEDSSCPVFADPESTMFSSHIIGVEDESATVADVDPACRNS